MCDMYNCPVSYDSNKLDQDQELWNLQDTKDDKVILETEITLKAGPNITMKIHEESRSNSVASGTFETEEYSQNKGVFKVLNDDSETDSEEKARQTPRTPRKVRFGGESIKLRTPESDNQQTEDEYIQISSIKITFNDAVYINTRKSHIPVRVPSLPSTPKKSLSYRKSSEKQYKSAPNLSLSSSKIPLRKKVLEEGKNLANAQFNSAERFQNQSEYRSTLNLNQIPKKESDKTSDKDNANKNETKSSILKHSRAEDILSPIPIHNEIEVFHNLTRSPERIIKNNANQKSDGNITKTDQSAATNDEYDHDSSQNQAEENGEVDRYDSFKVYEVNDASVPKSAASLAIDETNRKNTLDVVANDKKPTLQHSLSSLTSDDEIWAKSEALDDLVKMLKEPGTCESLEAGPATLLFEALFACNHKDSLHNLANDALIILIQGLQNEVLEKCLPRVTLGICKMGAPSGVRCALAIMKKLPPKELQWEILSHGFGRRTREGALQILLATLRLFPRQDVEVAKIVEFASLSFKDRRRRVRQVVLETLAVAAQLSTTHEVLTMVEVTIKDYVDFGEIMQVVKTRLSRKQLPTVNPDGFIRYSSPVEQSELDWISGAIFKNTSVSSSPLSSASSSTPSVNYWMHNSRHDNQFNNGSTIVKQLSEEDHFSDDTKIWEIDNGKSSKTEEFTSYKMHVLLTKLQDMQNWCEDIAVQDAASLVPAAYQVLTTYRFFIFHVKGDSMNIPDYTSSLEDAKTQVPHQIHVRKRAKLSKKVLDMGSPRN